MQATARHILVDSEARCLELKKEIESGGGLGSFGIGRMVPEFDQVVFSCPLNEVQGPVKTQFGYHLLQVTARD